MLDRMAHGVRSLRPLCTCLRRIGGERDTGPAELFKLEGTSHFVRSAEYLLWLLLLSLMNL